MISNFDTLALSPVPVHPSSRSPTDEHWNQIRVRLFFFATTVTCLGRHQSMCPCFTPQLKSSGFSLTHWESLPLFVSLSLHLTLTLCRFFFFFGCCFLCQSLMLIWFFIYLKCWCCLSVCRNVRIALDKLWNTEGINHCHLSARLVAHADRALCKTFPAWSNLDEFPAPPTHKSTYEGVERVREWAGELVYGHAVLCFCNLSQICVYTFTNEKSKSAVSLLIFSMPMAASQAQRPFL